MHATWILPTQLYLEFQKLSLEVRKEGEVTPEVTLYSLINTPTLCDTIIQKQSEDEWLKNIKTKMVDGNYGPFAIREDGSVRFKGGWYIPR